MPTNDDYWNNANNPVSNAYGAPQSAPQQAAQPAGAAPEAPSPQMGQPNVGQQQTQAPYTMPQQPFYAPAPVQPVIVEKKSRTWIVAIVFIVCLFIFTGYFVKSCSDSVIKMSGSYGSTELTADTVALINLDGVIQYDGTACSPEGFKELLDEAEADDHIKAVVIRVNSGGGTATAGEEMAQYLKDFSKPVVVSSASINASAAYEISAQADYIYVARSTEIGAIGTALELTDYSGLLDMLGIKMEVITSADSKDSSYGFRPLTDEERAYYQDMVNKINKMFIDNVMEGRKMTEAQVRELATGMPFTGDDAVINGLADAVGTREDAFDKAAELAGITDYDTVELTLTDYSLSGLSTLLGSSNSSTDELIELLRNARSESAR